MYYYFNVNDYVNDPKAFKIAHEIYRSYVRGEKALIKNYVRTTKLNPTNTKFAATDTFFKKCCELAGVHPSTRQASKFRRGHGIAHSMRNKVNE